MASDRGHSLTARTSERDLKQDRAAFIPAKGVEALGTAGICVAVGIILPLIVHSLGLPQRAILPMQFPVFLAGVLLSPVYATLVGIMTPALTSGFTGLPTYEQVLRMIPELAVYGLVTSLSLRAFPFWPGLPKRMGRMAAIAVAMIAAMILGRVAYVLSYMVFASTETMGYFMSVLIIPAIPGIIAQLILVPLAATRLERPSAPSVYDRKHRTV
jgi:hypothetical protein